MIEARALDLPAATKKDGKADFDLHRLAAAVVLIELSRHYTGFEGLCGAKDWQSLGMHYLATTDYKDDDSTAKQFLSTAVQRDPGNWLAQVALHSHLWREAEEFDDMQRYGKWLADAYGKMTENHDPEDELQVGSAKKGYEALRIRVQITRTAVAINAAFKASPQHPALDDARRELARLCVALYLCDRAGTTDDPWLRATRARAAAESELWKGTTALETELAAIVAASSDLGLSTRAVHHQVLRWSALPKGPTAHYSLGCSLATRGSAPDRRGALTEFIQARTDSKLSGSSDIG